MKLISSLVILTTFQLCEAQTPSSDNMDPKYQGVTVPDPSLTHQIADMDPHFSITNDNSAEEDDKKIEEILSVLYSPTNSSFFSEAYANQDTPYSAFTKLKKDDFQGYTTHSTIGSLVEIMTDHHIAVPTPGLISAGRYESVTTIGHKPFDITATTTTIRPSNWNYLAEYRYYLTVNSQNQTVVCNTYTQCDDYDKFTKEYQSEFGDQAYTSIFTYPETVSTTATSTIETGTFGSSTDLSVASSDKHSLITRNAAITSGVSTVTDSFSASPNYTTLTADSSSSASSSITNNASINAADSVTLIHSQYNALLLTIFSMAISVSIVIDAL